MCIFVDGKAIGMGPCSKSTEIVQVPVFQRRPWFGLWMEDLTDLDKTYYLCFSLFGGAFRRDKLECHASELLKMVCTF